MRKYQPDLNDPQENRATETLAACLVFSEEIRREFLHFLFAGKRHFETPDAAAYEVSTQQESADGSRVDLLIEQKDEERIVVEVKVRAKEDGHQIRKYRDWLEKARKGSRHYVFNLVKNHDPTFIIKDHGGEQHHTWKELYDHFRQHKFEATDASLVEHLCNFLEVEGIVNTWRPSQILAYGPGVAAKHALTSLFGELETKLRDSGSDYDTKILRDGYSWDITPCLEVGLKSWVKTFPGSRAPRRVRVKYSHEAQAERMYLEIDLWWPQKFEGDWSRTKQKLNQWLGTLRTEGFETYALNRSWKDYVKILSDHDFVYEPRYVGACAPEQEKEKQISRQDIETMNPEDLLERVHQLVVEHCQAVSKLK